jgi:hypothetical protein
MGVISTAHEVKFVRINATSDGDNTLISAVAEKRIRILGYSISNTGSAAGDITIQDSAGTPVVFGTISLTNDAAPISYAGGVFCPVAETDKGVGLEINCATNVDAVGHLTYQLI